MYIPKLFEETNIEVLHRLISSYPFASMVTATDSGINADHIPFIIDQVPPPLGKLRGHIARANPLWRDLSDDAETMIIFQGPQTYISPSWYPTKKETGKVVPTWNYAVVHVHGRLRFIHDKKWLLSLVETLTEKHETSRDQPWQVSDAPDDFVDKMLGSIVGTEIEITRLEGKWKVSQNRPKKDKHGVIEGLHAERDTASSMLVKERMAKD